MGHQVQYHPVTHCIFDMDGLLLDTEPLYSVAIDHICVKYGSKFTPEAKLASMGRVALESAKAVIRVCNLPISPETYMEELEENYARAFAHVSYMPGALALIKHLHKVGIPQAIATSSTKPGYDIKTKDQHEAFQSVFEHILTAGSDPEVKEGKPHPGTFLIAAERFKNKAADSKNVLVFEDSPLGVQAGLAAGMQVVWVQDLRYVTDTANAEGATLVIPSLEKFDPTLFGLPAL